MQVKYYCDKSGIDFVDARPGKATKEAKKVFIDQVKQIPESKLVCANHMLITLAKSTVVAVLLPAICHVNLLLN